jgi:hypothetical protein
LELVRLPPSLAAILAALPSISEISFLDSCVPVLNLNESAELFLLFVSSAFSVKSRGYFGEAAETFTRAACAPQIRGIRESRVIGGSLENRKKFSLNPVEGISTSDLNVYK